MAEAPSARVGVFVGNAWDPAEGRETPWIDLGAPTGGRSRASPRLAPRRGPRRREPKPWPKCSRAAEAPVLLLFDEALNFVNRHRGMAEGFHAFLQNLTVAVTGATRAAAVISLPRSQVEMTDWDQQWQDRITKVVRRVARDLIANDESEISEVVRRRLFEDLGGAAHSQESRQNLRGLVLRADRPAPLRMAGGRHRDDGGQGAGISLRQRFEACYPFHPSTLSVFQRKWRALVPVSADARRACHAGAMDFLGRSRAVPERRERNR